MKLPDFFKLPEADELESLDSIARIAAHKDIILKKGFLKKVYEGFYGEFKKSCGNADGRLLVELGSGGGFLKDFIPGVVTSDVFKTPGIDMCFSGTEMPFKDAEVDAFFMLNVFHHIPDASSFLNEIYRTLKPGGKMLMIEPANTLWSRFVYGNFLHEQFDPAGGWSFKSAGPMSSANAALPWIVFCRDRKRFEACYPGFNITKIRNFGPFRYIFSGGVSMRQLLPAFAYGPVKFVESLIAPLNGLLGMFILIEARKTGAKTAP